MKKILYHLVKKLQSKKIKVIAVEQVENSVMLQILKQIVMMFMH